jgi:hypothetical protein
MITMEQVDARESGIERPPNKRAKRFRPVEKVVIGLIGLNVVVLLFGGMDGAKRRAVNHALSDYLLERARSGEMIFVQKCPYNLDESITTFGKQMEIVERDELIKKYEGQQWAPSLASVNVHRARGDLLNVFRVSVVHAGVWVPGALGTPIGGAKHYTFVSLFGWPVLLKEGHTEF